MLHLTPTGMEMTIEDDGGLFRNFSGKTAEELHEGPAGHHEVEADGLDQFDAALAIRGDDNYLPDSTFHGVFLLEKVLCRVRNLTPYLTESKRSCRSGLATSVAAARLVQVGNCLSFPGETCFHHLYEAVVVMG